MKNHWRVALISTVCITTLSACAGPTNRTTDGKWTVAENICSSDPDNPDKGDMRSEIRTSIAGTGGDRIITFFHEDRTILRLKQKVIYRSASGTLTTYENSPGNAELETIRVRNMREVNNDIDRTIVEYFKNDPNIDGNKADSGCLYRGQ